ncbi:VOC family protein [Actinoplanes couchii]|uniref:Glyoxalase n=1 Tax=Actinoplanes couchii TaxID=403638 RepID=A0ABQ3XPG0_9ACTN|nr:VOC family protein [Actinoplanes couchii]MDR6315825.1 catechol 2,3-dioxygenase-like lactoylglutathione lyase family enzyme [Actinoplanes couchii]GID60379.1 glyoxalase [Actinoplanes couchii]
MTVPILRSFVLDTTDARRLAEFYRELLALEYRPGDEPPAPGEDDPKGRDWLVLRPPAGSWQLAFQQTTGVRPTSWPADDVPQQMHLDTQVDSLEELNRQHDRVLALGGTLRLDRSRDPEEPLRVYTDPDGHTFCVFMAG